MKKTVFFLLGALLIFLKAFPGVAGDIRVLKEKDFVLFFDSSLRQAAREVADMVPEIGEELEGIFGWSLDLRPSILLLKDNREFQKMTGNPLTVAFAVPQKNLIVIDFSKMNRRPFNLRGITKHELCHLLLHHHINQTVLPRWLDEGVAQWVSDGVGDIIMDQKRSLLNKAALRGNFIALRSLRQGFPQKEDMLILAYEESKSFIDHIIGKFGREGMLDILYRMKQGENEYQAVLQSCSMPLEDLEEEWRQSVKRRVTWFTYLSYHVYEILFALGAVITVYASIRVFLKKRAYIRDEMEQDR